MTTMSLKAQKFVQIIMEKYGSSYTLDRSINKVIKRMIKHFFVAMLFSILIISCSVPPSSSTDEGPEVVNRNYLRVTASIESRAKSTVTDTPVQKTETPRVVPTITPMSAQRIFDIPSITSCQQGGFPVTIPEGLDITGTIIYQMGENQGLYTIDPTSLEKGEYPKNNTGEVFVFGLSMDGKWLAYSPLERQPDHRLKFDKPVVRMIGSDGSKREFTFDVSAFENLFASKGLSGFTGAYWINNEYIFTLIAFKESRDYLPKIIDPFRGMWLSDKFQKLPFASDAVEVGISPGMDKVLYYGSSNHRIYLMDLNTSQMLWSEDFYIQTLLVTRWSPDGSKVVYTDAAAHDQSSHPITLLTANGATQEDIYFSNTLWSTKNIIWSPDSRFFAFAEGNLTGETSELMIYDTLLNSFVLRCPLVYDDQTNLHPNLAWSPDSSKIAFSGYGQPLRILDIKSGEVYEIEQNTSVVGWTNELPFIIP